MSRWEKAISVIINLRSCYGQSFLLFFSFLFFFTDGTTGVGEENCASLHVSKNRDNFQVSWTWTHSVKFPAIKKVISDCAISKKKKGSSRRIHSCFFTHNGITTPKTTREGQESTTKISLHLAWPPKFKNQVLFTPRAQNSLLDLGLLLDLHGCRPKSRSLPGRVEVIQPVVRACTTFWLTSTRITLTRVHRPVPYSRHPPYSRHFFNETHENDPVWALFPIAVSDDPFSTQVCKEILSILSFLEKLLSSIMPVFAWRSFFHWIFFLLKSRVNSR